MNSLTVVGVLCALSSMSYADSKNALDRETRSLVCPSGKKIGTIEYVCPNGKGDLLGCWPTNIGCVPLDREPDRHCPPGEEPGPSKYFCPNGRDDPLGCWSTGVRCVPQSSPRSDQVTSEPRENQATTKTTTNQAKQNVTPKKAFEGFSASKGRR